MRRLRGAAALALATVLVATGCARDTGVDEPWPDPPTDRPVVDLAFTVPASLDSATGLQNVTFTPDRRICELVFRAWPNKPATAAAGNSLTVSTVSVGGQRLPLKVDAAGAPAGAPGTLVTATLPACVEAGDSVTAQTTFTVRLGEGTDERLGRSTRAGVAWLGTAFPLLAWENGRGWARDPAVEVAGETATSEAFRLNRLEVTAPADAAVAGTGEPVDTAPGSRAGTTRHTFAADAVRDVTLSVGALDLTTFDVDGTDVTVALPSARSQADAATWRSRVSTSLRGLREHLGPVPYPRLWINVLPEVSDGVEYPGGIQIADIDPDAQSWLVTHELAHQWFHGLVGNDAARDPWLDEAFATYAQELVEPTSLSRGPQEWLGLPGQVGASMASFAQRSDADAAYIATVYRGGGRALLEARRTDGDADRFDEAVRAYLRDRAHHIARPDDLARHLGDLPGATKVLREAGALK